jgi:hypothetical protein
MNAAYQLIADSEFIRDGLLFLSALQLPLYLAYILFVESRGRAVSNVLRLHYPAAILRRVVAIVVDAVDLQVRRVSVRFGPLEKWFEPAPFIANANASRTVARMLAMIRVVAPLTHASPNALQTRAILAKLLGYHAQLPRLTWLGDAVFPHRSPTLPLQGAS